MRKSPRTSVKLKATLDEGGITRHGQVTDLGLKGAFVAISPRGLAARLVNLRFAPLPGNHAIEVLARVVRKTRQGIGVEFLDLKPRYRRVLWSAMASHLPEKITDCLYCGQSLNGEPEKYCGSCGLPLQFRAEKFLDELKAHDADELVEMIGTSQGMRAVFRLIRKVATVNIPVLVTGPSGTGKELAARAIHQRSQYAQGPFVTVNCAAIPRDLLESELFGREKGAESGGYHPVKGALEKAHRGTLFLYDVGELPLELQVKLLRFLQDFTLQRVGGQETIAADVRVISASDFYLKELIRSGRFREDLYYRLDGIAINLPPLKERGDDVLIMANVFLRRYAGQVGKNIRGFSQDGEAALKAHVWPGNVQELVDRIRRAVVRCDRPWVGPEPLGLHYGLKVQEAYLGQSLKEAKAMIEADLVANAINRCRGNIPQAAKILKISRSMVYHLVQKHKLNRRTLSPDRQLFLS